MVRGSRRMRKRCQIKSGDPRKEFRIQRVCVGWGGQHSWKNSCVTKGTFPPTFTLAVFPPTPRLQPEDTRLVHFLCLSLSLMALPSS